MFCRECGSLNDDNAWKCVKCGAVLQHEGHAAPPTEQVPNHLVLAILVTAFCCLPFGIVSIVYAAQVNSKAYAGDIQGAMDASRRAKTWALASLGVGLLVGVAYFVIGLIGAAAANS